MKNLFLLLLICSLALHSQEKNALRVSKTIPILDSLILEEAGINPIKFHVFTPKKELIDSMNYQIDYVKGKLIWLQKPKGDSVLVSYVKYPEYLTKTYKNLDKSLITQVDESAKFYTLQQKQNPIPTRPFSGLHSSGSIARGITLGNNQNSVLNSELDLRIEGKINENLSLRASIQDAGIPIQERGYSQRLDEFDQIFVELSAKYWKLRAGDINLEETNTYFSNFNKRIQGLKVEAQLSPNWSAYTSGALARGQFTTSVFQGLEGNQGPYKLVGPNNELYVLIISGSETVFVNGIPLKRGENEDYIIDYNSGEITFNPSYQITSEMRITVDYQFTDRNYNRFSSLSGTQWKDEKLKVGVSYYTENDIKSQPLQLNLSDEQKAILAEAGDNQNKMVALSAVSENFSENRILYKKEMVGGNEIFVFSINPDDDLFRVNFSLVGDNQGNYIIATNSTVQNIYQYITPLNGVPQGNFEPIIQLIAPVNLSNLSVYAQYTPTEKSEYYIELNGSNRDQNLFSTLDDKDNRGWAGKFKWNQLLFKKDSIWEVSSWVNTDFVHKNFNNIERLYNPEFNRDWGFTTISGNQSLINAGFNWTHQNTSLFNYQIDRLSYSTNYLGIKHELKGSFNWKSWRVETFTALLNSKQDSLKTDFIRSKNSFIYQPKNKWIGAEVDLESYLQKDIQSNQYTALTQKYLSYHGFVGIGNKENRYMEMGFKHRINDSLRAGLLTRVNKSDTYYINAVPFNTAKTNLSINGSFRKLKSDKENESINSLSGQINYNQLFAQNLVQFNANYQTQSGRVPQQSFTYVEVEPGKGFYVWNDYNENGIQELSEFELAQFQDQATYIRVLLPNQIYVNTHQNQFSSALNFNPSIWKSSKNAFKNFVSHFHNRFSINFKRNRKRNHKKFSLSPFSSPSENDIELGELWKNVLFLNRGKQKYTSSYTFLLTKNKNLFNTGFQTRTNQEQALDFNHKLGKFWLFSSRFLWGNKESENQEFISRNFDIDYFEINPKIALLWNDKLQVDLFFEYEEQKNILSSAESLIRNNYGFLVNYSHASQSAIIAELQYIKNGFSGLANTAVGYEILEGLQAGNNFTWKCIFQKKITQYLDVNLNYEGRKTETAQTIHTGSIQLKAYF